mgnify:CR=1 FL=1
MKPFRSNLIVICLFLLNQVLAEDRVQGRRSLVLNNDQSRLVIDIAGGSIPEFRFNDSKLNPLNWGSRNPGDQTGSMGHFLCCDRWGPPSDAEGKNIKRGDFFNGVNGTSLNDSNYITLLFGDDLTYTLNMASIENGKVISNGINIELTKEQNFESNPIQVNKTFNITDGQQIGYLMYNQFVAKKSEDLNDIFGLFDNKNIDHLIIDLRYNGGGSVKNCVELASMITGQFKSEVFAEEQWNKKLVSYLENRFGSESLVNRFVDTLSNGSQINSLNLDRIYMITSSESASASELLINGLSSYIDVIQIGERTVGKNVGSITVYDYVDNEQTKNPDHTYAMQPIVLKMANSDGFADYTDGLEPNRFIEEDITNLGVLGELGEPLLTSTLNLISGTKKLPFLKSKINREFLIIDPRMLSRQKMIIKNKFN